MLDLKTIQSLRTARVEILHPLTGEPLGAYITLLSSDNPARRAALLDYQRVLRKIGDGDSDDLRQQRSAEHVHYIASCLSDWEGISDDGAEVPFSVSSATELLLRPELDWLLSQISTNLIDSKNFIAAQPKA